MGRHLDPRQHLRHPRRLQGRHRRHLLRTGMDLLRRREPARRFHLSHHQLRRRHLDHRLTVLGRSHHLRFHHSAELHWTEREHEQRNVNLSLRHRTLRHQRCHHQLPRNIGDDDQLDFDESVLVYARCRQRDLHHTLRLNLPRDESHHHKLRRHHHLLLRRHLPHHVAHGRKLQLDRRRSLPLATRRRRRHPRQRWLEHHHQSRYTQLHQHTSHHHQPRHLEHHLRPPARRSGRFSLRVPWHLLHQSIRSLSERCRCCILCERRPHPRRDRGLAVLQPRTSRRELHPRQHDRLHRRRRKHLHLITLCRNQRTDPRACVWHLDRCCHHHLLLWSHLHGRQRRRRPWYFHRPRLCRSHGHTRGRQRGNGCHLLRTRMDLLRRREPARCFHLSNHQLHCFDLHHRQQHLRGEGRSGFHLSVGSSLGQPHRR